MRLPVSVRLAGGGRVDPRSGHDGRIFFKDDLSEVLTVIGDSSSRSIGAPFAYQFSVSWCRLWAVYRLSAELED